MINIVTLTFLRDLRQTLLQAESIQKFVSPCVHFVIVTNNWVSDSQKNRWRRLLQPYYTKHKLVLIFLSEKNKDIVLYLNSNYWNSFKYQFTIAETLDDDYLVLNAKNFFWNPTNLEDLRHLNGNLSIRKVEDEPVSWRNGIKLFCDFFKVPVPNYVLWSFTPAMVKRNLIISKIKNFQEFSEKWA